MNEKRRGETAHIGDILADRNIELVGADAFTRHGFTQVPNPILKSKRISPGAKLAYTALLSYAWNCNYCYPGQQRMGEDIGVTRQTVNEYIKELERKGYVDVKRRGQGRSNYYTIHIPKDDVTDLKS